MRSGTCEAAGLSPPLFPENLDNSWLLFNPAHRCLSHHSGANTLLVSLSRGLPSHSCLISAAAALLSGGPHWGFSCGKFTLENLSLSSFLGSSEKPVGFLLVVSRQSEVLGAQSLPIPRAPAAPPLPSSGCCLT